VRTETIGGANLVYACGERLTVTEHRIAFPELGALNRAIEEIDRRIEDASQDAYLWTALRRVKLFRFECCAVPRTHDDITKSAAALAEWLHEYLKPVPLMYPDLAGETSSLLRNLERVRDSRADRLLGKIKEICGENVGTGTAILVKASRLVAIAAETWKSTPELAGCRVLSQVTLREDIALEHLIVCGPPRWFDDFVFTAPRARMVSIVCYDWVSTRWRPRVSFMANLRQGSPRRSPSVLISASTWPRRWNWRGKKSPGQMMTRLWRLERLCWRATW
jgi:hypothetical protein